MAELKTTNPREAELHSEIEQARVKAKELEKELHAVTVDLQDEEKLQEKYSVLSETCESLVRLEELGGSDLFWGEHKSIDTARFISDIRDRVTGYENIVETLQNKRRKLENDLEYQTYQIYDKQEAILDIIEQEERKKYDFVIEREIEPLPFRPMVMPWSKKNEDEKQLRKFVAIAILYSIFLWLVIPMINLPLPDFAEETKVPERIAKMIKKEKPKPKVKTEEQTQVSQKPSENREQAKKKVQKTGLLAFKDNFTELMNVANEANLGANADISNSGQQSNQAARNLVVAKASGVSGISSASLSRNTGGAGKGMKGGVAFTRVESSIGMGDGGPDRPNASSAQPRTDEEIQMIFDRYKAALYRIYQRELRKDPSLRGNIVLRIVIGPDGNVILCKVESSDIKSATLPGKIVARVKRFQFGRKKGAAKMTILYPIDFLPAT